LRSRPAVDGATTSAGRLPKSSSPTSAFNQSSAPRGRSRGVAAMSTSPSAPASAFAGPGAGGFFLKKLNMDSALPMQ